MFFFVQISEYQFVYKWHVLLHFKPHFVILGGHPSVRRKFLFSSNPKAIMAQTIKLFQHLETVLQSMAVLPSGQNQNQMIFWKRVFYFLSMILYIIASLVYFVSEAKTVVEYGDSFYMFSTESTTTFYLFTYIRKIPRISAFIDKFNDFFQKSM